MNPRQPSAGTAGMVAGVALGILLILFFTSGITPDTLSDPAKALPYISANLGRWRTISTLGVITVVFATFFVVGIAAKLHAQTPTRAVGVLYFGLFGAAAHGISSILQWGGAPAIAAYAAQDQVAANHAWVAFSTVVRGLDGFANVFVGLSILLAGWAIVASGALRSVLGWVGVIAGVLSVLAVAGLGSVVFLLALVGNVVWLIWAGSALRTA